MARRLKTIAKEINERPELHATIVQGFCDTDRDIPGTRLRHPGKGRWGNRVVVKVVLVCNGPGRWAFETTHRHYEPGDVVLDHNSAETYRTNSEVEEWLERWKKNVEVVG